MTPRDLAAEHLYGLRNRAKDALMFIENAVQPADLLTMLIDDARRTLRAVAREGA